MTTLTAKTRTEQGRKAVAALRQNGMVPGVVYGPKEAATPVSVSKVQFDKALAEAGESTVLTLSGIGEDKEVLIHDVSHDPVTGAALHVDFYAIEKGKKVTVHVPLSFVGTSPAEKELGGTIIKVLHEIEVEAMPKDLPHEIEVNVELLKDFETPLHVKDIVAPAGVAIITDAEEVVATAEAAKDMAEEEPVQAIDMSAIEVAERGKKEEEGAEEEAKE